MASFKFRVVAAAARLALWSPRWTWWVLRRLTPPVIWARRWWLRVRPSAEARLLATLTQELQQAASGDQVDWRDVYALGEVCIRRRAYAEAVLHFRRVALAPQTDRELQRAAASWLGRALEYAGDTRGACAAYCAYLEAFPEISSFERRRLERRLQDLAAIPASAPTASVTEEPLSARERPSRLVIGSRR